jgi:hypothetical protein
VSGPTDSERRAKQRAVPCRLRQLVDSGIPLAMSTDAYRAATFNPWVGISEADVRTALQSGIGGYLLGDCGLYELVDAVPAVGRGSRSSGGQAQGR